MNCPHCNFAMPERLDLAGQSLRCPKCNGPFMVPLPMAVVSPQTTKQSGGCFGTGCLIVVALIAVAVVALMLAPSPSTSGGRQVFTADRSPGAMSSRATLLSDLISRGVFTKIEMSGNVPVAWTGSAWSALSFDEKKDVIGLVVAQHADKSDAYVSIKDGRTGKRIGTHSTLGLRLD